MVGTSSDDKVMMCEPVIDTLNGQFERTAVQSVGLQPPILIRLLVKVGVGTFQTIGESVRVVADVVETGMERVFTKQDFSRHDEGTLDLVQLRVGRKDTSKPFRGTKMEGIMNKEAGSFDFLDGERASITDEIAIGETLIPKSLCTGISFLQGIKLRLFHPPDCEIFGKVGGHYFLEDPILYGFMRGVSMNTTETGASRDTNT